MWGVTAGGAAPLGRSQWSRWTLYLLSYAAVMDLWHANAARPLALAPGAAVAALGGVGALTAPPAPFPALRGDVEIQAMLRVVEAVEGRRIGAAGAVPGGARRGGNGVGAPACAGGGAAAPQSACGGRGWRVRGRGTPPERWGAEIGSPGAGPELSLVALGG